MAARLTDQAELKTAATALRLRLEQEKNAEFASRFAQAYAAVSGVMVERANPQVPPTLVIEILTMAGHPYVKNIQPLLFALKPATDVDFGGDVGAAVRWETQTYRIRPEQLRPQPLEH